MFAVAVLLAGTLTAQEAAPAPAAPLVEPGALASQPLTVKASFVGMSTRVPLPYESLNGLIAFKATVAGREVWTLLDTGAERSVIDTGLAAAVGLKVGPPEGVIRTSTGTVPKRRVSNVPIVVDKQFEVVAPAVAGMDLKPLSDTVGRKIEFILGAEFLGLMQVMVDPGPRTINLLPSGVLKAPPNFPSVPLLPGLQIEALVGNKPVSVGIDTGSTAGLTLSPEAWARVGPADAKRGATVMAAADGQPHLVDVFVVPKLTIGRASRTDVKVQVIPRPTKSDGLLGMGVLGQFFLVVDAKAGKLWLMPRLSSAVAK
jgi:predicted aspartyl protease